MKPSRDEGTEQLLRDIRREVKYTRDAIGRLDLDECVYEAIASVPREQFIPEELRYRAYDNGPVPIGNNQTISQPYIVALMTDLLRPQKSDVILEVGTGSGYQAAVLSLLVDKVYTMEIIDPLASSAKERLERLGYPNVEVKSVDGYFGWEEHAPFDGIIVTAAAPHVPQCLVDQLKPGGRLIIPLGMPYSFQQLVLIEKDEEGDVTKRNILGVAFVPLTGDHPNP